MLVTGPAAALALLVAPGCLRTALPAPIDLAPGSDEDGLDPGEALADLAGVVEGGPQDASGSPDLSAPPTASIGPQLFGMHSQHWPPPAQPAFGGKRLWDSQTAWSQIETSKGVYTFATLDARISAAQSSGADLYYTFGRTPASRSSQPTDTSCAYENGSCDAPTDVDALGAGTDAAFVAFVDALLKHVCNATAKTCSIKYFEMWNEPNAGGFWTGTYAQLARMSSDAVREIRKYCVDCVTATACPSAGGDGGTFANHSPVYSTWMAGYLQAWMKVGNLPDAGAWHPYPARTNVAPPPFPESNTSSSTLCKAGPPSCRDSVVTQVLTLRGVLDNNGLKGAPMIASEGAWGDQSVLSDPDQQAAWLARWFLALASGGVTRAYWYQYDNASFGTLWDSTNGVHTAGIAYAQMYKWLVGAKLAPCTTAGTIWSCQVTQSNGSGALVLWDSSATCSGGMCTTSGQTVGNGYSQWLDLAGTAHAIVAHSVPVGMKPIFVQ
jgi:hypothetical protein